MSWIREFLEFSASLSILDKDDPSFVKQALDHASIDSKEKQLGFARMFNKYRAFTPELLNDIENEQLLNKAEISDLQTSFRLADLTQSDFSVVKAIKESFDVRTPEAIRSIAKHSEQDWIAFVKDKHHAGEIKLPFHLADAALEQKIPEDEMFAKTLSRQLSDAFPTAAWSGGLERALDNCGGNALQHGETIKSFLDVHQNFEFMTTPVDEFLENGIHPDFRNHTKDDSFRIELKAIQRVMKLSPTFESTDVLLADKLHSAQQIYRIGKSEFVRRYADKPGFTKVSAESAWNKAADTHAATVTILAELNSHDERSLPMALKTGSDAVSNFPNWKNLFQAGDYCECEHCRSVLSPAAYFADLLMFLRDRKAKNPASTVKDVLFDRRADLGFLELNCDNALTPLPYIDVVCEVLEGVVADGENDTELTGLISIPADPDTARTAVETALTAVGISLGAGFSLSQVNPSDPDRWVVHGEDITCLLKKKASPNFFVEILRNTKASAAELRSYPQYVNPKAYEKLREAKYPSS
ncbi:MAG TPA: hypothetical protein ENK06_04735, partial [Gammaproteobacteria bacterium]|nr:hypothetical protein [Gammaproteobacteria bacterium]